MVVAFDIPRPWPQRSALGDPKPGRPRWQFRYSHASKWKPWQGWRKFWTVAGTTWYWPPLVTVWHVEPDDHDALTVCGRDKDGRRAAGHAWRWHVHHWKVQIRPVQRLRRWLFERCELCGHRYPYGYAPVAHQWDQPAGKWFRVSRRAYHHECSSLVHVRRTLQYTEDIVRHLVAETRLRSDETEPQLVERLTSTGYGWEFSLCYRFQTLLGYERDDDYALVKKEDRS